MEQLPLYIALTAIPLILFVLAVRWVGAWMLRINEIINELREIKQAIKEIRL